jgi:plasmid stability protein
MLEEDLFRRLKKNAAEEGQSFKTHVNDLLRQALQNKPQAPFKLEWKTIKGDKAPAVPIHDRDRLYDFLDES